jgi:hypothetical protein
MPMVKPADRAAMEEMLRSSICMVTFKKINGETRSMPCTLMESLLPPPRKDDPVSQKRTRDVDPAVMVVYCTDKAAFRSFRVDNLISMEPMPVDDSGSCAKLDETGGNL